MKNKTIGMAVIGAGGRGHGVTANLLRDSDGHVSVRAVYDPDPAVARKALESWKANDAALCGSHQEAIRRADVDWVLIFSPNAFHKEHILEGFAAGKHVFSEKPLATTIEDCETIYRAHQESGRMFATGFVLRYAPIYRQAMDLLRSGRLGKILSIDANENITPEHGGYIMTNWRRHVRMAGPHILEKCCHDLDLLNWFADSVPARVAAFGGRDFFVPANRRYMDEFGKKTFVSWPDPRGVECPFTSDSDLMDNHVAILEFRNGIRAMFQATLCNAIPERRMYFSCTEGNMVIELYAGTLKYRRIGDPQVTEVKLTGDGHGGGDDFIMKELYECMVTGVPPKCGGDEGLESAVVALAIDQSIRERGLVDLEPVWRNLKRCAGVIANPMCWAAHNEEVRQVWAAYQAGRPIRVPVGNFTVGPRIWVLDPALNNQGISWQRFSEDPRVMFDIMLQYKFHLHHHVVHDLEMGIPAAGWAVFVEFVNTHEPEWFGCGIHYPEGQVTAASPAYAGDRLNALFDRGLPDPFDGVYARVREFYEYFLDRARGFTFHGKPVSVALPGAPLGTDGPLSVAFALRGEDALTDMLAAPDVFHRLLDFITTATIRRVRAWRQHLKMEERPARGWISDDVIQLISTDALREHVLPYHRRLLRELYGEGPHSMHLCGNVQRHLPLLVRELNIREFDTGFPVRFETLRDEVGPDVAIQGGVHVDILRRGSADEVAAETRRILESGIRRGGRFVMKEANNLPPAVPEANLRAMYETTRRHGRYD